MSRAGPATDNTINLAVLKTLLRNRTHHQPCEFFFAFCITLSGNRRLARRKKYVPEFNELPHFQKNVLVKRALILEMKTKM